MPGDNGSDAFESEEIAAAMHKRGKEKPSGKEMHEVTDTVHPDSGSNGKRRKNALSLMINPSNVMTAPVSSLLYAPRKMVKVQCVMIAQPEYPLESEFLSFSRTPASFL